MNADGLTGGNFGLVRIEIGGLNFIALRIEIRTNHFLKAARRAAFKK